MPFCQNLQFALQCPVKEVHRNTIRPLICMTWDCLQQTCFGMVHKVTALLLSSLGVSCYVLRVLFLKETVSRDFFISGFFTYQLLLISEKTWYKKSRETVPLNEKKNTDVSTQKAKFLGRKEWVEINVLIRTPFMKRP